MAHVTKQTIAAGDHVGVCQTCQGESASAWSELEMCLPCIATILPKMLVDALED